MAHDVRVADTAPEDDAMTDKPMQRKRHHSLDELPLFASEEAISAALMGPGKTTEWRQIAPLLERRGFPTIDGLMGGRYVRAIKAFFDREYAVHGASQVSAPHAPAELGTWKGHKGVRRG
jgi:hypothetical protein